MREKFYNVSLFCSQNIASATEKKGGDWESLPWVPETFRARFPVPSLEQATR